MCPIVKQKACSEPTSSCAKLDSCTNEEAEDICRNDCSHDLNSICYEICYETVITYSSHMPLKRQLSCVGDWL